MADLPESQNSTPEQQTSSSNRFFIPLFLGFSSHPSRESTEPDQETNRTSEQVVVMISFFNQDTMTMIPNYMKDGPLPASKASIEAMRKSEISQEQGDDGECSICLEQWKIGEEVREMPCKHLYHSNCIEKWLGIHGSCPVCRFKMPVDDEEESNKEEERGTRVERELSEEERRLVMNLLGFLIPPSNNNNNNNNNNQDEN